MKGIFAKLKQLTRGSDGSFNPNGLVIIGFVLFAVVFVAYITYDEISSEPQSKQNQLEAEKELNQFRPPLNATSTSSNLGFIRKAHHGNVGMLYRGNLTYEEIRAHYDAELAKYGWKFQKEENVKVWDKDYGGKELTYSKGIFRTFIYYPGADPDADFTFSLNVGWDS